MTSPATSHEIAGAFHQLTLAGMMAPQKLATLSIGENPEIVVMVIDDGATAEQRIDVEFPDFRIVGDQVRETNQDLDEAVDVCSRLTPIALQ